MFVFRVECVSVLCVVVCVKRAMFLVGQRGQRGLNHSDVRGAGRISPASCFWQMHQKTHFLNGTLMEVWEMTQRTARLLVTAKVPIGVKAGSRTYQASFHTRYLFIQQPPRAPSVLPKARVARVPHQIVHESVSNLIAHAVEGIWAERKKTEYSQAARAPRCGTGHGVRVEEHR